MYEFLPFVFGIFLTTACVLTYHIYANIRKSPPLTSIFVIASWLLTTSFLVFIPQDFSLYLQKRCIVEQNIHCNRYSNLLTSGNAFNIIWNIIYWSSFINVWVIIPFFQSYYQSGGFTIKQRIFDSIRANLIFYVIVGVIALVVFIILVATMNLQLQSIKTIVIMIPSYLTMLLFIIVLGIGIVDVPRGLWRKGSLAAVKRHHAFHTALQREAIEEETDSLAEACQKVSVILHNQDQQSYFKIYFDDLREEYIMCIKFVRAKLVEIDDDWMNTPHFSPSPSIAVTDSIPSKSNKNQNDNNALEGIRQAQSPTLHIPTNTQRSTNFIPFSSNANDSRYNNNQIDSILQSNTGEQKDLTKKINKHREERSKQLGSKDFIELEEAGDKDGIDIKKLMKLRKLMLKGRRNLAKARSLYFQHARSYKTVSLYEKEITGNGWTKVKVLIQYSSISRFIIRVFSVILGLLSALITWGEAFMFLSKVNISPISIFLRGIRPFYGFQQFFLFIFMCYLTYCSLSVLIRIRLFNYYHLVPHLSDPPSLFFFACYASMLVMSCVQNVLVFLRASKGQDTHYSAFIIILGNIKYISNYFFIFYPIVIVLVVILTIFNVLDRILGKFNVTKFGVGGDADDLFFREEGGNDSMIELGERMANEAVKLPYERDQKEQEKQRQRIRDSKELYHQSDKDEDKDFNLRKEIEKIEEGNKYNKWKNSRDKQKMNSSQMDFDGSNQYAAGLSPTSRKNRFDQQSDQFNSPQYEDQYNEELTIFNNIPSQSKTGYGTGSQSSAFSNSSNFKTSSQLNPHLYTKVEDNNSQYSPSPPDPNNLDMNYITSNTRQSPSNKTPQPSWTSNSSQAISSYNNYRAPSPITNQRQSNIRMDFDDTNQQSLFNSGQSSQAQTQQFDKDTSQTSQLKRPSWL
ncbi:MAG: hypothetical protein EZS28_022740 [Streblomastix strix]|uniref:LMBR1 domain-containing protein 2 n=1 Tax=Streblomastix strix TaxID=222440 RepID=A0A5J4VH28_9EUKA|nr:MAG: hypothetical protein EZS28_022740 [Streblomastix strix]